MKYVMNTQDIAGSERLESSYNLRPRNPLQQRHRNIIDLLRTAPSALSFDERVIKIGLSPALEEKTLAVKSYRPHNWSPGEHRLSENDEKELAGEVFLRRHKFTRLVFENRLFRQAAITIIQNIYLFRQRKIFFGTSDTHGEQERREALLLFSTSPQNASLPLAKTFQHLILARVWDRIVGQASDTFLDSRPFIELHEVVEQLNTLRNIYMLLSIGLVRKLTGNINTIYRQSITREDAHQIGSFGIARAAYRYHPSSGLRFSTYASHWILKEIQRQALEGRLIRVSSNLVEKISRQARNGSSTKENSAYEQLCRATAQLPLFPEHSGLNPEPVSFERPSAGLEKQERRHLLLGAIHKVLSPKSGEVILRRFGLGPYQDREQSVIEIAEAFGVTRGSIYQLEQTALRKLRRYISPPVE
jgi:RNA polymerase sigma factor (sigma-70 family)